jgi:hypothetical protein
LFHFLFSRFFPLPTLVILALIIDFIALSIYNILQVITVAEHIGKEFTMKRYEFKRRTIFCTALDSNVEQESKYEILDSSGMNGSVPLNTRCSGSNSCRKLDCNLIAEYGGYDYCEPIN